MMGIIFGETELALNCYKIWVILEATLIKEIKVLGLFG